MQHSLCSAELVYFFTRGSQAQPFQGLLKNSRPTQGDILQMNMWETSETLVISKKTDAAGPTELGSGTPHSTTLI